MKFRVLRWYFAIQIVRVHRVRIKRRLGNVPKWPVDAADVAGGIAGDVKQFGLGEFVTSAAG